MDARPHRPRPRVFADENNVSSSLQTKTLHSRHKSQPALKAGLATNGPQRFGQRSAFGDVSNVAANKILQDDSVIKSKGGFDQGKIVVKEIDQKLHAPHHDVAKSNAARVRGGSISSAVLRPTTTAQNILEKVHRDAYSKNVPRVLRKAKTTIFSEKSVLETRQAEVEQELELRHEFPVATETELEPHQISLPEESDDAPGSTEPIIESIEPDYAPAILPLETIIEKVLESDVIPGVLDSSYVSSNDPSSSADESSKYESALEYIPGVAVPRPGEDEAQLPEESLESHALAGAIAPEPEEYWDVEEDDGYADDGYVTARSFKSVGDGQLTGNVTRTLYPHVDQAVKHELAAARALVESNLDPAEVEDEAWDTSMVQEYGDEIFQYMRELEVRMSPNPHYMDKQNEIQWSMRSVLMDWIVQVHHRFGLLPETLFLTVNLIDRFLSQKIVSLTKLQLVGATAIFVAAKYEEVDCPSVQEINFMVDNGYGVEEILKAERFMLSMLGFELGFPGPMSFLRRISKADDYDLETRTLAKYFLEITLMDERFLTCVPSFTAAGAHCLARMMLHKGNWSPAHVYYSEYTYTQLLPLISLMLECCDDPVHHHNAIYEKYLDKRYKQAAKYVQTELDNGFRVPSENVNPPSQLYSPVQQQYSANSHLFPSYWPQAII